MEIRDGSMACFHVPRHKGKGMGCEPDDDNGRGQFGEGLFEKKDIDQIGQRPQQIKKRGEFEKLDIHLLPGSHFFGRGVSRSLKNRLILTRFGDNRN